jgi:hypothetical protein
MRTPTRIGSSEDELLILRGQLADCSAVYARRGASDFSSQWSAKGSSLNAGTSTQPDERYRARASGRTELVSM